MMGELLLLSSTKDFGSMFGLARLAGPLFAVGLTLMCAANTGCSTGASVTKKNVRQLEQPLPKMKTENARSFFEGSPEFLFLLGRELEGEGRLEEALEAYESALEGAPGDKYLLLRAAQIALLTDAQGKALGLLEKAQVADPGDVELRVLLGKAYVFADLPINAERILTNNQKFPISIAAGEVLYRLFLERRRIHEAIEVCRFLIDSEPENFRGYDALITVYRQMKDLENVESVLLEALEKNPSSLRIRAEMARLYRDQDRKQEEISAYREILRYFPNNEGTLISLAEVLFRDGQLNEADLLITRLLEKDFRDDRLLARLGFLAFDRGNFRQSYRIFVELNGRGPNNFEAVYYAGLSKLRVGDYGDALALFESIPEAESLYPDARIQCAVVFEKLEDFPAALGCIREALEFSKDRSIEIYLSSLLVKSGDLSGGISVLESLLAKQPTDIELLFNMGVLYGEAQLEADALDYMNQVLVREPDHPGALNYVGYTWVEQGLNLSKAEDFIRRALEVRPEDGFITDSLGWLFYKKATILMKGGSSEDADGYLKAAIIELKKAAVLTGGDPVVCEHLGDAYLLQGDRRRALENYQKAIDLIPRKKEQPNLLEKYHALSEELLRD